MSQLIPTTNDLIVNSLYLIGELGVGEVPDSFMLSTGLTLINELLAKFSVDSIYIPYLATVNFTMVPNQSVYSFSTLPGADVNSDRIVDLSMVNFFVQTISYPISIITKSTYYGVTRVTNLQTRPGFVFLDKQEQQSLLTFYPAPDQPYPCQIQAKLMLDSVSAQEQLIALPPYYYGFLKYALARKFLAYYPSGNWPKENEDEYQDYYQSLKNGNETDMTIRPSVIMMVKQPFYWQQILAYP